MIRFGMVCAAVVAIATTGAYAVSVGDECIVNGDFEQASYAAKSSQSDSSLHWGLIDGVQYGFTVAWRGGTIAAGANLYGAPSGFLSGTWYLALDNNQTCCQKFYAPATGTFNLTFRYAHRTTLNPNLDYQLLVRIDGDEITPDGAASPAIIFSGAGLRNYSSSGIMLSQGEHVIELVGTVSGGETACLIDGVSLKVATIAAAAPSDGVLTVRDVLFHVDASDTSTISVTEANGKKWVDRWNDASGGCLYGKRRNSSSARGFLGTVDGKPVVDFGEFSQSRSSTDGIGGSLDWSMRQSGNVKEVYLVLGRTSAAGNFCPQFLLGDTGDTYNFHSGYYNAIFHPTYGAPNFDLIEVNGVAVSSDCLLEGGMNIIHVRAKNTVTAGSFAADRPDGRVGGMHYGEVLVYPRSLTSAEQSEVYSYLCRKWRPAGTLDLVDYSISNAVFRINVNETSGLGGSVDVRFCCSRYAKDGFGDFETIASGLGSSTVITKEITNLKPWRQYRYCVQFVGADGVFAITNTFVAAKQLKRDVVSSVAPAFHVDALASDTIYSEPVNGTNFVSRWDDCDGGSRYCSTVNARPFLSYHNGRPVMDFGNGYRAAPSIGNTDGDGAFLRWSSADSSIRDVFLVLEDTWGQQFLLGCDSGAISTDQYDFHRGEDGQLFHPKYTPGFTGDYQIRIDREQVDAQYVLGTNIWHVIRLRPSKALHAELFAAERLSEACRRLGGYRLAEAIIYDTRLSEDQADAVCDYLHNKWLRPDRWNNGLIIYWR